MNETVSYRDFVDRFRMMVRDMYPGATPGERRGILAHAWEECAWCDPLTDERGIRALVAAAAKLGVRIEGRK